ncbi:MAG TPA: dimethylargininase [Thermoanaerobaculia bacterium]|nr:dimethylargininase [Thermoanaerobaculia bacterium]
MRIALTRAVSPRLAECELSFVDRKPIDVARAIAQHEAYERCLEGLGCRVLEVEPAPDLPDSVFVEDAAVVLDALAVITRPGAPSRRAETESVARALRRYRAVRFLAEPATLDGGDVLLVDRKLFVGRSRRTNDRGIAQLRELVEPIGYSVAAIPLRDCLHLKSAVTHLGNGTILLNPDWVDAEAFAGFDAIAVDPAEPFAANTLRLDGTLLMPASHPGTRRLVESRGFHVETVDCSELEKAEGGVTCCSLIFES